MPGRRNRRDRRRTGARIMDRPKKPRTGLSMNQATDIQTAMNDLNVHLHRLRTSFLLPVLYAAESDVLEAQLGSCLASHAQRETRFGVGG